MVPNSNYNDQEGSSYRYNDQSQQQPRQYGEIDKNDSNPNPFRISSSASQQQQQQPQQQQHLESSILPKVRNTNHIQQSDKPGYYVPSGSYGQHQSPQQQQQQQQQQPMVNVATATPRMLRNASAKKKTNNSKLKFK
ncbi:unnamed protein product [[Candida] boidinii]|nr:unnamed protein product [[Candida] boidinii]